MMKYYTIEPEVAGGWGKNTVFDRIPGKGTFVHKLHYEFDGWLGDELVESSACYVVTERMVREIERAGLTGARFDEAEVTTSEQFRDIYPNRQLPKFVWLRAMGKPGQDDFVLGTDLRLMVSERALELLKRVGISHAASVTPVDD
jgi:hypothetical protein